MRTPRSPLLGSRALRPRAGLPRHVLAPGRVPVAMNGRVMLCEVARANKGFPTLPSSRERRGPASSQDRRPSRSAEGRWIERTGERAAALRSPLRDTLGQARCARGRSKNAARLVDVGASGPAPLRKCCNNKAYPDADPKRQNARAASQEESHGHAPLRRGAPRRGSPVGC